MVTEPRIHCILRWRECSPANSLGAFTTQNTAATAWLSHVASPLESSTFRQVNREIPPCDVTRRGHRTIRAAVSVNVFQQLPNSTLCCPRSTNTSRDNWWLCDVCSDNMPQRATCTARADQLTHMYRNCADCHCLCILGPFCPQPLLMERFTFISKWETRHSGKQPHHLSASKLCFYVRTGVVRRSWWTVFARRC